MTIYDVAGFQLLVCAEAEAGASTALLAPVERLLGRFRAFAPAGVGAWTLRIGRSERRASSDAGDMRKVWEGPSPAGFQVVNWAAPGRKRCDLAGVGTLDVDLVTRDVMIDLLAETDANAVHYFLTTVLCDGLVAAGHCVVHAACLEKETTAGRRAVLIVAPSGTGKSTTALAMTDSGWRLMGDDLAIVTPSAEGVFIWGYPRFCNVRRPTRELLPWLDDLPFVPTTVPETFALPLEHLGDRAGQGIPAPTVPAAIICLERPNRSGHRIQPLDRAAALMHIAQENVLPIENDDFVARRSFAAFGELVRATPAYTLSAGPQLGHIGAAIDGQLSI